MSNQSLIVRQSRVQPSKGGGMDVNEIRVLHGAHFSLRMPLNTTQQAGATL